MLLAPTGSELAHSTRPIRPREIARLPLIGYRRADEGVEAFLRSRGLEPDIVFRSDEGGIVQGLVGAGIGYAVVPLLGVGESTEVVVLGRDGRASAPDHDRLACRPGAEPGGAGVRRDRDRDRVEIAAGYAHGVSDDTPTHARPHR